MFNLIGIWRIPLYGGRETFTSLHMPTMTAESPFRIAISKG